MATVIGGFKDKKIESRSKVEPSTTQYLGRYRQGLDVFNHNAHQLIGSDSAESGTTTSVLVATAHTARVGDLIKFSSGALLGDIAFVQEVTADTITLSQTLVAAPAVASTFQIWRPGVLAADASGNLSVSFGGSLTVEQGSPPWQVQSNFQDIATETTLANLDSKVTVCNTGSVTVVASALPTGASTSANQSTIIGHVDGIESALTTLNAKDFATQTTLAALNTKVTTCDTGNVTIAALPNEGQQTMANSISVAIASNQSAVPISDNGGSITVDGTVGVSGTVAISAASLPLPTGAATETTLSSINTKTPALGQTTMAGSSPVAIASNQTAIPITDNSGSLTVDGTVAATQSGTWNINNISGTVSLPTGAATEATLSSMNAKLSTNAFTSLKVSNRGEGAGLPNFYYNFAGVYEIPSMFIIDPITLVIPTASNAALQVTGDEAHDAADDGNPNKIGIKAADYEPTTSDVRSAGKTAVAANDRSNVAGNLYGEMIDGVNSYFFTLDNVSTTYNNTTTTASSTAKECWNYRQATFSYELTRANSPTDILFEIEVSLNNGSTFTVLQNDFLGDLRESTASITASGIKKSVTFPIACHSMRVKATATGTTASATFTVANACIYFRN